VRFAVLVLQLGPDEAERLSEALLGLGALSVDMQDALAGTPDEKPLSGEPGADARWALLRLTALFPTEIQAAACLRRACKACGLPIPTHETQILADEDWVRRSQQQFAPIQISRRVWIVPSWHQPPDPHGVNISLDPGLAFGTGSHASTRLCLRWLEATISGGESVLDYGCGSGILTIAALRLGAGRAVGVDIDPRAVAAASANAERNGVSASFSDAAESFQASMDVVVANILANPLKVLAPVLARHCRPGGRLALSGLLTHQAADIRRAYAMWFRLDGIDQEDDWICLSGTRL
jgi:ribosomal protein L11 methyltransferase